MAVRGCVLTMSSSLVLNPTVRPSPNLITRRVSVEAYCAQHNSRDDSLFSAVPLVRCTREDKGWKVGHWDFQASLAALRTVCERYAGRACVCGVGVCNEPATSVPAGVLGRYYEAAIETVRLAGMRAGEAKLARRVGVCLCLLLG